jgi:hypothetical protein
VEILDKLLDGQTAPLTRDRALHNVTIDRGFRSFTPYPDGCLTSSKLPGVAAQDKSHPVAGGGLRDSYVHQRAPDAQVIVNRLVGFLSQHQLKQFQTKRRRIRAHFGSLDNIAATALTFGQRRTPRGIVGGYVLKVDARHGIQSLSPASEGYFYDPAGDGEPVHALIWALTHVLFLQLEQQPLKLFLCGSDLVGTCTRLIGGHNEGHDLVEHMVVRLLGAVSAPLAQPCLKGKFFDRMQAKLNQLTAHDSNELVTIDLRAMADVMADRIDIRSGFVEDDARSSSWQS